MQPAPPAEGSMAVAQATAQATAIAQATATATAIVRLVGGKKQSWDNGELRRDKVRTP